MAYLNPFIPMYTFLSIDNIIKKRKECKHVVCFFFLLADIPLLPSIMSLSLNENGEKSGPFVVHWLNNKELHFTLSMEVFLQQFKRGFEHISSETTAEEANQMNAKCEEGKLCGLALHDSGFCRSHAYLVCRYLIKLLSGIADSNVSIDGC